MADLNDILKWTAVASVSGSLIVGILLLLQNLEIQSIMEIINTTGLIIFVWILYQL
ncbi:MAG: hypothetical protein ACTSRG_09815 [Candidatus Helarchaeota archaeon]